MADAPPRDREARKVAFVTPDAMKHNRAVIPLVRSDNMVAMVQMFTKGGGEKNLHYHESFDGFWFVLSGRVRFYGDHDAVMGEAGPHEGFFIPKSVAYWFEQVGEEPLQILQVEAIETSLPQTTKMLRKPEVVSYEKFSPTGERIAENVLTLEMEQKSRI